MKRSLHEEVFCLINKFPDNPEMIAPDVHGMSSAKVRLLLNKIVGLVDTWRHLEVGSYKGSTFIAALLNNLNAKGIAFENHSEYSVKEELINNLERYSSQMGEFILNEVDFFKTPRIPDTWCPINSFFYDGDHSFEKQKQAVIEAFRLCSSEFIFIADDWNWNNVRKGTWAGIDESRPTRISYWELNARWNWDKENYHNGLGLFVISKR